MSKQDDDLSELQKLLDEELKKIETSQPKKQEKKPLVDSVAGDLKIPVEDRYLYDLLGAYAGSKLAGKMDRGIRAMPEPSASAMRDIGFGTAGLGPAGTRRAPPMNLGAPSPAPTGGMPMPVAGGPAGPVGGPPTVTPQATGSGVFNYGKAFDLTDIEAARALDMTKQPGGVHDLTTQRREALQRIQQMGGGYAENPRYGGIMTPEQSVGAGPKASFTQQPAIPPSPDMPSGRQPGLAQIPTPQPVPTALPRPSPLSQVASALKQGAGAVLNTPGVSGALGGLGVAESGQEFFQRRAAGDVPGQFLAGMGMVGGGMAMVPNPMAKAIGASLATASPLSLYLYDKIRAPSDAPELTEEEIMFASRPAIMPVKIRRTPPLQPRIPAPGTNLPPVEFIR